VICVRGYTYHGDTHITVGDESYNVVSNPVSLLSMGACMRSRQKYALDNPGDTADVHNSSFIL